MVRQLNISSELELCSEIAALEKEVESLTKTVVKQEEQLDRAEDARREKEVEFQRSVEVHEQEMANLNHEDATPHED